MSSTDRQNRLLLAEDWKRVYQSFRNADFQSYDFDNLRRTMISYIRDNYPEDFNDYIESSEYLALIDLIAYLGQNIAFRIDLNARENFIELAERRESVLRLARLLSYNPKRNQAANGLLKLVSVKTTEEVRDSNNLNLENQTIIWNDPANPEWYEQFIKVLNSSLPVNGTFGRPSKKEDIDNVPTEQYRLLSTNTEVPIYSFSKNIDGRSVRFEIVSSDFVNGSIVEEPPFPGNNFAFLYRDDGRGPASSNTGFFSYFKQGGIDEGNFTITQPSTNQTVAIDAININNNDVWLYKLDSFGNEEELWTQVDSVEGNNVIYNSLSKKIRNIYSVLSRVDDRISLIFSDGVFGDLPKGAFRVYYRASINQCVTISPENMRGISVSIPYLSRTGKQETLTCNYELKYRVDNSSTSETNASIRANAPSTYYTQNRMVTAEDYQVAPLGVNQEIIKVKSVNRVSSGLSRYFDIIDATGKYSTTNLYGKDGVLYKEYLNPKTSFDFTTRTDIDGAIVNIIEPILRNKTVKNYYYDSFPKILVGDLQVTWNNVSNLTNLSTGYFTNKDGLKTQLGTFTTSILKLLVPGTLVKFVAPAGYHFMGDNDNKLMAGTADHPNAITYKWVKITSVTGDGTENNEDGSGPVYLNDIIPNDGDIKPIITEVIPAIAFNLTSDVQTQVIDQIFSYKTFGLRFDRDSQSWNLVTESNLNVSSPFGIGKQGDTTNQKLDSSWLLLFETDGSKYTITYRTMRYIFESEKEIRFYFDSSDKIYNNKTGKTIKDRITVLNINTKPDTTDPFTTDYKWEITEEYRDPEGYVDSKKIQVTFFDEDDDGVVDNPEIFADIVDEDTNASEKYIFLKKYVTSDGVQDFNYVSNKTLKIVVLAGKTSLGALSAYNDGQIFYYIDTDSFEVYNKTNGTLSITSDYKARLGRDDIKFQYVHAADSNSRIDPSVSNIIDSYILTKGYDTDFRLYLQDALPKPFPPSSDQLFINFGNELNKIKSLSDEIIYHPVKYKVLFGNKSKENLQAVFKIVKNPDLVLNDNDVKSRVIQSINEYFALDNWDFGDTFYFSELSNYVMSQLSPDLVTFIIVPKQDGQSFGSLFEIKAETDEIFISSATVNDVEVIDAITANRLRSTGNVVTESPTVTTGVQSSNTLGSSSGSTSSSSSGGSNY